MLIRRKFCFVSSWLLFFALGAPCISAQTVIVTENGQLAAKTATVRLNGQPVGSPGDTIEVDVIGQAGAGRRWSDPDSWPGRQIPTPLDDVVIQQDTVIDGGTCRRLTIESGTVTLTGALHAHGSVIVQSGARLRGSSGTIYFYVADDRQNLGAHGHMPDPVDIGLWIMPGGEVDFQGIAKTPWLSAVGMGEPAERQYGLSARLAISGGLARLSSTPLGWAAGDRLLLTNEYGDSAVTTLLAVEGRDLLLDDTDFQGSTLHYRQRQVGSPKIANLSRSLRIVSALCVPGDTHHRAHTLAMEGAKLTFKHVEFRNLGPRGIQGEYPIHVHHGGENTPAHIEGCSIWQDCGEAGNRWATIHDSDGVKLLDNVGYLSRGHGFFMESGTEQDCVVMGNLGVEASGREEIPVHSPAGSRINFAHTFWMWSGNTFGGNVSVGRIHGWATPTFQSVGFVIKDQGGLVTDVEGHEHYGGHSGGWCEGPSTITGLMVHAASAGVFPSFAKDFQRIRDSFIACDRGLAGYAYPGHIVEQSTILADRIVSTQGQSLVHIRDSDCVGDFLTSHEVWRAAINFEDCELLVHRGVTMGASFTRNQMYTIIRIVDSEALVAGEALSNADFCSRSDHIHAHGFEGRPIGDGDGWILHQLAPDAGYIRCSPSWKGFWTVTPEGHPERPRTEIRLDSFDPDLIGIQMGLKGYFGGLPPGNYRVKVWSDAVSLKPVVDQFVTVRSGETVRISTGL